MVAVINNSSSLRNVLHYNENKIKADVAKLILASGFAKDADDLSFSDKIRTFQKLTELNERTKVNSVHISLNFDPSESFTKSGLVKSQRRTWIRLAFPISRIWSTNITTQGIHTFIL